MGVSNILGTLTGGLLGGPKIKEKKPPKAQKTAIDPNRGAALAEARQQKRAAAARTGRSSLRIDLTGDDTVQQTRSGIRIG